MPVSVTACLSGVFCSAAYCSCACAPTYACANIIIHIFACARAQVPLFREIDEDESGTINRYVYVCVVPLAEVNRLKSEAAFRYAIRHDDAAHLAGRSWWHTRARPFPAAWWLKVRVSSASMQTDRRSSSCRLQPASTRCILQCIVT